MMKSVVDILSPENPVFNNYVFYTSILLIKMVLMGPLTLFQRQRSKVRYIKRIASFNPMHQHNPCEYLHLTFYLLIRCLSGLVSANQFAFVHRVECKKRK